MSAASRLALSSGKALLCAAGLCTAGAAAAGEADERCGAVAADFTSVWVASSPGGEEGAAAAVRRPLTELLAAHPLAPEENIKAVTLARSARSAQLLVQVREREPLHYHADSDLTVFLLRGRGRLRLGEQTLAVCAGDVLHIPRGVVHAYLNDGPEPGAALVVMSPAPGPHDRVLVEGAKAGDTPKALRPIPREGNASSRNPPPR